jgi:nicotinate-nucleotide pyrophosphorylase
LDKQVIAKKNGIIAGWDEAKAVFENLKREIRFHP